MKENINLKEKKKIVDNIRKYVKPYGFSIRFRINYYENTDYTLELFNGYCHQRFRVWESYGWHNTWDDFNNDIKSLVKFFDKYYKKEKID